MSRLKWGGGFRHNSELPGEILSAAGVEADFVANLDCLGAIAVQFEFVFPLGALGESADQLGQHRWEEAKACIDPMNQQTGFDSSWMGCTICWTDPVRFSPTTRNGVHRLSAREPVSPLLKRLPNWRFHFWRMRSKEFQLH
jgi:hypothetical protein